MKKIVLLTGLVSLFMVGCSQNETKKTEERPKEGVEVVQTQNSQSNSAQGVVKKITAAEFKELVYNYDANPKTWVYRGTKPCVIDFYADWCRPCKIISPILDELAKEYAGKVDFYKVDTQVEQELASVFQIQSIPLVVFSGVTTNPESAVGAYSKEEYKKIIDKMLTQK